MLAGVPLLRTRRHGRGTALLQPASYVAAAAHLAVVILVFTNVVSMLYMRTARRRTGITWTDLLHCMLGVQVQMYYLFTQTGATCTAVAPCSSSTATTRQNKVSNLCVYARMHP